ncbi:coiled-coil domain-containing protein 181 isoform X2 [Zonotrichia leucophrys gambelii]|uniref:coiled-coil domain-containing protein 181 isoform X2 n=1 Tax=Zonotrichia leucophrys gambelii TaxID=257770 RepID=UPI0031407FCD
MSEKEAQGDVGDSTENTEYEDDFEKDLTDEEEKQNPGEKENPEEKEEDVEAKTRKTSDSFQEDSEEMKENLDQLSEEDVNVKVLYSNEKYLQSGADSEQDDHESDAERESSIQESKLENEQELDEGEDEEIKRYVLEKIEEANKELENQAPVHGKRERKLKFVDEVDLHPNGAEVGNTDLVRGDVSDGLSQLNISDRGQKHTSLSERAGSDIEIQQTSEPTDTQGKEMPPSDSNQQPDSALNGAKSLGKQKTESANIPAKSSTYTLTPRQKELRKQIELKKETLKRREEEKNKELEEMRKRQNEIVFKAWLQKKKEQVQQEKRIRRAKRLEELRLKEVHRDPEEAYSLWLKKKHQQYVRERRIEVLRRQTEEVAFYPSPEDCDRAFREWLRRKREEKEAAELAAKERARQLRLEARRAKQMRNIHYI